MNRVVAAVCQLTSGPDVGQNLRHVAELIERAASRGGSLCALPENFALLAPGEQEKLALAETLDAERPGPIVAALAEAAQKHRVWVVGGGMPEKSESAGKVYNTCVVVD